VKANLGFYHFDGIILRDTLVDSLNVYLKSDSTSLYYNGLNEETDSIALPLSMNADSSTFIFQFDSLVRDTITFRYKQYLKLVSHECGFVNFFNITGCTTTTHRIDSVWIRKDLVEYGKDENIKIYF
jgi:hypothetical protein